MSDTQLAQNTLFLALTRPAMTCGVTHEYFFLNGIVSVCAFILSNNLAFGVIWIPIHIIGVLAHRFDNRLIKIAFIKAQIPKGRNDKLWGVRCYEPY